MRLLLYAIALGLAVHGLIHLMGLVAYWPLGTIAELPYKTALLNGRWEVGNMGMRFFSVLWLTAAVGFLLSALGLLFGWGWVQPLLLVSLLLSLAVTVLDWQGAFRGALIDTVLLAGLLLLPSITTWLPASLAGRL